MARTRLEFGTRWWSQQWLSLLEQEDPERMARGRSYARHGQVRQLEVKGQRVTAKVAGSRNAPYRVEAIFAPWTREQLHQLYHYLPEAQDWRGLLERGELPPMWMHLASQAGVDLIPAPERLSLICTCPDWGWPCKHAAAVCCLIAERLDNDPLLLLTLQGLDPELLGDPPTQPEYPPLAADPEGFWGQPLAQPLQLDAWPEGPLLENLGGLPRLPARRLQEALLPIYGQAAEHAQRFVSGEMTVEAPPHAESGAEMPAAPDDPETALAGLSEVHTEGVKA
ncbi:MAG: hypothetical protein ACO1RX_17015 [Candidatus Sericytochromatia bacterium]